MLPYCATCTPLFRRLFTQPVPDPTSRPQDEPALPVLPVLGGVVLPPFIMDDAYRS